MISTLKQLLTIESVVESAGISIVRGHALCPFHHDTTPSMSFKHDRFRCWACNESGDIIDFMEKFYGVRTGEAIRLLAAKAGLPLSAATPQEIRAAQSERERRDARIKAFRSWEQERVNGLSFILREYRSITWTEHLVDIFAPLILIIDDLDYEYSILCGSDDDLKLELYREAMQAWR